MGKTKLGVGVILGFDNQPGRSIDWSLKTSS